MLEITVAYRGSPEKNLLPSNFKGNICDEIRSCKATSILFLCLPKKIPTESVLLRLLRYISKQHLADVL